MDGLARTKKKKTDGPVHNQFETVQKRIFKILPIHRTGEALVPLIWSHRYIQVILASPYGDLIVRFYWSVVAIS